MTRYLLLVLFVSTMGSRTLGLESGLAPGLSIKNALLYMTATLIAIESALMRNRHLELFPVIVPYLFLILYALITWLVVVLFLDRPYYDPIETTIRLKTKLIDQFLMLLVFFYGIVKLKEAMWLLKALLWVIVIGSILTVADTFDLPDLGIIATNTKDGSVEGLVGSSQEFGGFLAFSLPLIVALWWTQASSRRMLALVGVSFALISLILTGSRGAMLGVTVGGVVAAIYVRSFLTTQVVVRTAGSMLLLIAIALALVLSTEFSELVQEQFSSGMTTGNLQTVSSGRTAIWTRALGEMADYPLSFFTGLGWEAYYQTIGHRYATHSVYLDRLYNLGAIGVALFVMSYLGAMSITRRSLGHAPEHIAPYLIGTIVGTASYMVSMAFSDTHGAALFIWALLGIALRVAIAVRSNTVTSQAR